MAGNRVGLKQGALDLSESFPFIPEAVQAHLDREAKGSSLGRPMDTLRKIISELDSEQGSKSISKNFGPIFQKFCRREAIYGYGDLQVLRMVEQLQKDL